MKGSFLISTNDSAELNFKKAEAIRASQFHFWIIILNGIIIAYIPLMFNATFREVVSMYKMWIIAPMIFAISTIIILANLFYKLKYNECRTKYVMFYSIDYLKQYCSNNKLPINEISEDDLPAIVQMIYENTSFDEREISDGIYTYCFEILNVHPKWIDKELEELKNKKRGFKHKPE